MNILVPINLVPDLVEELEIDDSGKHLDTTWLRMIINEFDDHAIEQGILLKERYGGKVTVLALALDDIEETLFNAAARGADQLIRLHCDFDKHLTAHATARLFANAASEINPDLILTGVQTHNDLDGQIGPLMAEHLGLPYVGYISAVRVENDSVLAHKEYPGGLIAEMQLPLPAILGIQAADEPPRYVAFSKVRQAMNTAEIEDRSSELEPVTAPLHIRQMAVPESSGKANMLEGTEIEIAAQIISILNELKVQ